MLKTNQKKLIQWYNENKRTLPWRKNKNPYHIWISEVMLQQTTVGAVIPYYKAFIKKFRTLKKLAQTPIEEVLPYWSGLGYYNRIKNLHSSAQMIEKQKHFPRHYKELLKLPGFGSYTARAVSSFAFNEKVGVLDTNVIRVLSRYYALKASWWKTTEKNKLQSLADKWVENVNSAIMNQALMELGALICTNKDPMCSSCPLNKNCQAYKTKTVHLIPKKKRKKKKEVWLWKPKVIFNKNKLLLTQKHSCPFLKKSWLFPGPIEKRKTPPKKYHFTHFITHHAIYVQVCPTDIIKKNNKKLIWLTIQDIKQKNPSSLIQKVLDTVNSRPWKSHKF